MSEHNDLHGAQHPSVEGDQSLGVDEMTAMMLDEPSAQDEQIVGADDDENLDLDEEEQEQEEKEQEEDIQIIQSSVKPEPFKLIFDKRHSPESRLHNTRVLAWCSRLQFKAGDATKFLNDDHRQLCMKACEELGGTLTSGEIHPMVLTNGHQLQETLHRMLKLNCLENLNWQALDKRNADYHLFP